ncbi:hypothetical protein EK904_001212 [Melospiza melodia maxima]|nr:hypothetical protein EK904_001212 [Melospiza melodia maxima]
MKLLQEKLRLAGRQEKEDTEPWYSHKVYARYWRHYDSAMRWMHRHQKAYRRAMESLYCLPWHPWHPAAASPGSHYSDWHGNDLPHIQHYSSSYRPDVRAPCHGGAQQYAGAYQEREDADEDSEMEEDAEMDSEMEEDSESEGEIEYDLSNMEITEELRKAVKAAAAAVEKSSDRGEHLCHYVMSSAVKLIPKNLEHLLL